MGFFGFLKKPVAPPTRPSEPAPDLFNQDLPPPPKPTAPPPMELIHDEVHRENLDLATLPSEPAFGALPNAPAFDMAQAQSAVPSAASAQPATPAPAPEVALTPPMAAPTATQEEEPLDAPPLPELPPRPAEAQAPLTPPFAPANTAEPTPVEERRDPLLDLPDFSEDDIARASSLTPKIAIAPQKPVPQVRFLEPPELPGTLYVSASQYQESLRVVAAFKASVRKGDAALAKLGSSVVAHKQPFAKFADAVNVLQSQLIQIDNVMIRER